MPSALLLVLAAQPALHGALLPVTSAVPAQDGVAGVAQHAHLGAEELRDILVGLHWGGRGLLADEEKAKEDKKDWTWQPYEKTHMGRKWDDYQAALARDFKSGSGKGQLKVLVVTAVSDSAQEVLLAEDILQRLVETSGGQGDVFHWALFHHDNTTEHWTNSTLFTNPARNGEKVVVFNHVGPGCKAQNWGRLPQDLTEQYDYIWLLDSDMRFDFFRWDLYRAVLTTLNPLVSQPSILPPFGGGQSSAIKFLPIHPPCDKGFPVAIELPRTEVQAPLISTKIWPAIRTRMLNGPSTTVWFLDAYWDAIAQMAKDSSCGQVGPVLVNAAPLWHQAWKTLAKKGGHCPTWKGSEAARRDVSSEESEEARAALLKIGCQRKGPALLRSFEQHFRDLFSLQSHQGQAMCEASRGMCRKWVDAGGQIPFDEHVCFTEFAQLTHGVQIPSNSLDFAEFAKRGMVNANDTEHLLGGLRVGFYVGTPGTTNARSAAESAKYAWTPGD